MGVTGTFSGEGGGKREHGNDWGWSGGRRANWKVKQEMREERAGDAGRGARERERGRLAVEGRMKGGRRWDGGESSYAERVAGGGGSRR